MPHETVRKFRTKKTMISECVFFPRASACARLGISELKARLPLVLKGVLTGLFILFLAGEALAAGASEIILLAQGAKHIIKAEIAATPETRSLGLMFRRELAADAGMLFDFQRPQPVSMWMRNTLIPLDMLFIAEDGRIVNIAERTVPGSLSSISSAEPVRYVLEVPGGTVSRLGLKPGDKAQLPAAAAR
jgi:uncharacterized membrane protein (UPF0127 family)